MMEEMDRKTTMTNGQAAVQRAMPSAPAGNVPPVKVQEPRGGIQSIERAFALLEEIARHRNGIGLAELAKTVGLHTSTSFHLLRTMVSLGYLGQFVDSKRYHVGQRLFGLAANALTEVELVATCMPVIETLAKETGESAHFALQSFDEVMIVARVAGAGAFQLVDRTGGRRPAHCTAVGKALLSTLSDEQLERFLGTALLAPRTPHSITTPVQLRTEILRVRATGIAYDDQEFDPELRCMAMPVRDFTGRAAGAVGISGPVWRLNLHRLDELKPAVLSAAQRISAALGGTAASVVQP
jgi:DNA-binding IclR family transcriptional regulator